MIQNAKGTLFYGMHMYPGVAEYAEPGKNPYRVFLNEDTIRSMDPSFAGRPVYVQHVDEVTQKIDDLRGEVDGWVSESFYNAADGKHWVKFLVVSEKGLSAIKRGMRLSNCYLPKQSAAGGLWNGVTYAKEITGGEYEHLAIVPNPRYEESVILTPEEFKRYNEDKTVELKRLANAKKESPVKFKFFKREKIENSVDIAEMLVLLPKSNREVSIEKLVNEADELEALKGKPRVCNDKDTVKVGETEMTVGELVIKFNAMCDEVAKKNDDNEDDDPAMENEEDDDSDEVMENEDDEDDEDKKKKKLALAVAAEKEAAAKKDNRKKNKAKKNSSDSEESEDEIAARRKAKAAADRVRNAHTRDASEHTAKVFLPEDRVARGKTRYGSN